MEGVDHTGSPNSGLLINYFCGRNTYINTNNALANQGGAVYMGDYVSMASSAKIGSDNTPVIDNSTALTIHNGARAGLKIVSSTNNAAVIAVANSNFAKSPFTVLADGKTYIGNERVPSRPNSQLTVSGEIDCKALYVLKPTTWSDFVFSKNYNLNNLDQVEKFIKKNKHLPGVPSEKEVLENGYDVNEMHAALLAKIEELYLYVIKQQKEIDDLKATLK